MISLVWPLRVWQILAFAPIGVAKKLLLPTKNTKLYYYAIVAMLIHVISLVLSLIFSSTYIDWSDNSISKFDDFLAMVIVRTSSCIIVGEAIFKLNKNIDFLKQIIRIDFILCRKLQIRIDYKKYQFRNNLITAIWICGLLFCLTSILITMHELGKATDVRFWSFYIGPLIVYSMNYHRMVMYVFVIRRRYQFLNQFIEKICMLQEKSMLKKPFDQLSKKEVFLNDSLAVQLISESQIKDIRNIYHLLYEATEIVNELFLWSLPLGIAIDFHRLLVNVFFIFAVWLLNSNWIVLIIAISWGCLNAAHIIMLSHACHTTSKEVGLNEYFR